MVFARLADLAQRLQAVGVVHEHYVLLGIHHVQQTALRVDRQTEWIHQAFVDLAGNLVISIEHQDLRQLPIGDEHAIVVVHGNGVDHGEVCFEAVADQLRVPGLGVEHEHRPHLLVGHIQPVL